jgi:hypothetical protein
MVQREIVAFDWPCCARHLTLTAAGRAKKDIENIGWATSADGVRFVPNVNNPVATAFVPAPGGSAPTIVTIITLDG